MDPIELMTDIADASELLAQDLKFPVRPPDPGQSEGNVFLLQYVHPDVVPVLVYHLVRCGWRKHPEKALVKQRPVIGSQFADLVKYVPLDEPDEPIYADRPRADDPWSVTPKVTVVDEERPQ